MYPFPGGQAIAGVSHSYGTGSGLGFVMNNVHCTGSEMSITQCSHSSTAACSLDTEVAAVKCTGKALFVSQIPPSAL